MILMSTSLALSGNLIFINPSSKPPSFCCNRSLQLAITPQNRRFSRLIPNAKKKSSKRRRSWWKKFFFDDDGNWLGLKDDDMLDEEEESNNSSGDDEKSEKDKFEAWKRRAEAIVELREAQEDMRNEESRRWEDWVLLDDGSWDYGFGEDNIEPEEVVSELVDDENEKGLVESVRDLVLGNNDDDEEDILYEDRVFRYASFNSAKFLAVLIIVPWALDFAVHDYVLMPFLDLYVKKVPLAAQMLDVRRSQKLEMVKELKVEKSRYRLEVEIGKSPPLSEDEMFWELRNKALELREEWRLENRRAFANIWSDMVFGVSLFVILYFNQSKVALLKFTGYKIVNNISDTGKAFIIILVTDIFLGYHSESGWETLLEIINEHYGFVVDGSAITIFVCLIPVIIDACVKLWLFKFLPRLSPRVSNIFQEMKRH